MPVKKGSKREYFPKVREAREALAAKALDLFEQYESLIKEAIAAQEFEVAQKGLQFLMEHLPTEDGTTFLEPSIDKGPGGKQGPTGPTIQIGIALGTPVKPKELPPVVVDVTPEESK